MTTDEPRSDGAARPHGITQAPPPGAAGTRPGRWTAQGSVAERRELLEQLQVVDIHVQTAASLDTSADRCANAVLAGLLRDRARQHRRSAERMRADLAQRGPASCRSSRRPHEGHDPRPLHVAQIEAGRRGP